MCKSLAAVERWVNAPITAIVYATSPDTSIAITVMRVRFSAGISARSAGKVELLEPPPHLAESRVVIPFFPARVSVDLKDRRIDEAQAADIRGRLQTMAEDWQRPEMDIYDEQ